MTQDLEIRVDLYAVLGVSKTATPEEIRRAYRRCSKSAHPDAEGGSAEAFAKLQHAYNILSDPERRERYDNTGDATEKAPDMTATKIHSFVMGAFSRAMDQCNAEHDDLVEEALEYLQADHDGGNEANRQLLTKRTKFEKVLARLKHRGDGPDLLGNSLRDRIADIDRSITGNEETMSLVATAIERLKSGYEYEFDEPPASEWAKPTPSSYYPSWTLDNRNRGEMKDPLQYQPFSGDNSC